jgi:hypothetical protein
VSGIVELGATLAVTSNRRTLLTVNVVPSSPILISLIIEALRSSKTPVLTRATRRITPEDGILQMPKLFHTELYRIIIMDTWNNFDKYDSSVEFW